MSDHLPEVPRYRVHAENLHRWAGVPPRDLDQAGYREVVLHADHAAALAAQATAHEAARRAAYTLMGASIQSAIEAEQAEHEAALTEPAEPERTITLNIGDSLEATEAGYTIHYAPPAEPEVGRGEHVDWCRDVTCGGCVEVKPEPHVDPCDCDDCTKAVQPQTCAVCGEPVMWTGDPTAPKVALFHVRRNDHAATLTPPEPPAGTPVWWDGKWWYKHNGQAWYTPVGYSVNLDSSPNWPDMPGAIPASIPGGDA